MTSITQETQFLAHNFQNSLFFSSISESTIDEELSKGSSFEEKEDVLFDLRKEKEKNASIDSSIFNRPDLSKYKTELCKSWEAEGKCSYGSRCRFAHGNEELMAKNVPKSYKSKLCKSFDQKHFCPYGLRCTFIHSHKPLSEIIDQNLYLKEVNSCNFQFFTRKRLPIFVALTKDD